jgi:hypothetical protein
MGATEEQMKMLSDSHVTHVSYILILYSIAFLLFLFVNILLHLYAIHAWPDSTSNGRRESRRLSKSISRSASAAGGLLGTAILKRNANHTAAAAATAAGGSSMNGGGFFSNGKVRMPRHRQTDSQQIRDAETFELEGLINEGEEEEDEGTVGSASPREREREMELERDVERA